MRKLIPGAGAPKEMAKREVPVPGLRRGGGRRKLSVGLARTNGGDEVSEYSPRPAIRVTVWGENLHEKRDELVQKLYPDGMHTTIAAGISEHLGDRAVVRVATLDQPEHGLERGSPGGDGRAHVVGPHRPRPGGRRGRRAGEATCPAGHGPRRAALGPLVEDLPLIDGDELQPAVAFYWRARARLDRQCRPSDHEGGPARLRHRGPGDVRGTLRHPSARRAGVHF